MGVEDKAVPLNDSLEQCHLTGISYIHILTHSAHMGMIEESSLCNSFTWIDSLNKFPFNLKKLPYREAAAANIICLCFFCLIGP